MWAGGRMTGPMVASAGGRPAAEAAASFVEFTKLTYLARFVNVESQTNFSNSLAPAVTYWHVVPASCQAVTQRSDLLAPVIYFADMKHFLNALVLLSWLALPAVAQTTPNLRLKHELDSLYEVDQRYRAMLFSPRLNRRPDSLAAALGVSKEGLNGAIMGQMIRTDATNLTRILAILKQYGYPGKSLVGAPTDEAAWSVIQHAPALISQYLPMMKTAAEAGELPFRLYATMLDRQLMFENKEQVYGTQARSDTNKELFIWPIQNPAQVNQRRKQAGFKTTVEESAARLGTSYKVLTLEEVATTPK